MHDLSRYLEDRTLIMLSNREPYEHRFVEGAGGETSIEVRQPPGGLVSALDPTMQATHGVWVAWGSGSADVATADAEGRVFVPPAAPAYTLRRVFLDEAEVDGYYLGFANSSLWPLCHLLVQHFHYRAEYWERYRLVNEKFARAVADEIRRAEKKPVVWIQDYHFGLAAEMIREHCDPLLIHQFWHIPFPPADILRLLPVGVDEALLRGMLGNDLIEFHTERYALNFLGCVAEFIPEAEIDAESLAVHYQGRQVEVASFPISIDMERYEQLAQTPDSSALAERLRSRYARGSCRLGLGVDRVDYTKGIPERLRALRELWERHPEMRERFTFLLVATPSRSEIPAYKALEEEVVTAVMNINARYRTEQWTPIVLVHENVSAEMLAGVYRAADLCLVSSLQDGMNLVAKEFVACQIEERGVLVLSRFTGAAEEIDGAVLINPFNLDGFVEGIRRAINMSEGERRVRMHRMRAQLRERTIFDWLAAILSRTETIIAERRQETGAA
ncbi:MAG TPA: trehalose-6-phosphate synthase [Gemmatimonadaceae bacterium]|nr:trehalose-6-phosphate synthase [Gemmatimonadaceae bacterium]